MIRAFSFALLLVLSASQLVHAQSNSINNLADIPNVELIPLKKNEPAPLAGVLLPPLAIAAIVAELEQFNDKLKLELDKVQRDADANLQFKIAQITTSSNATQKILETQLKDVTVYSTSLLDQLNKLESSRPKRLTWYVLGAVTGVVAAGLTSFAVERALH